jgi:predicted DNA-binding transcriptional regulator AlpA
MSQTRNPHYGCGSAYKPTDPLLTPREAAIERGQALSTFWRDVKRGRVPGAIYVSARCPRWRLSEIIASVEACRGPRTMGTPGERGPAQEGKPPVGGVGTDGHGAWISCQRSGGRSSARLAACLDLHEEPAGPRRLDLLQPPLFGRVGGRGHRAGGTTGWPRSCARTIGRPRSPGSGGPSCGMPA